MRHPSRPRRTYLLLAGLICASFLFAACTRSASPEVLPTSTPSDGVIVIENGQEATMAAISTEVAQMMTQTAVAVSGVGGGEEVTPEPPIVDPMTGEATATPPEVIIISPTPAVDVVVATPIPPGVACPNPYTVQTGDWIYKIARQCNVSPAAIIAANPGINPDRISPGQLLNMPAPGTGVAPGAAACTGTRTVVRGDTLFRLAHNCGLTAEQLAAHNGITFPYTIYPGQVISYP
jgi:LysM repeat protein